MAFRPYIRIKNTSVSKTSPEFGVCETPNDIHLNLRSSKYISLSYLTKNSDTEYNFWTQNIAKNGLSVELIIDPDTINDAMEIYINPDSPIIQILPSCLQNIRLFLSF